MEGRLESWVKKVNELTTTNWQLQNIHGDVKYSIGNIVNNILIGMYGIGWTLDLLGEESLTKLYESLTTVHLKLI